MAALFPDNNPGTNGFSTIFGDLVFGLLFVFFLLAIALVFNRPDVEAFHEKLDAIQEKREQNREEMEALKEAISVSERVMAEVQEKSRHKDKQLQALKKEVQQLKGKDSENKESYQSQRTLFKTRIDTLKRDYADLRSKMNELKSIRNPVKAKLQREINKQKRVVAKLGRELNKQREANRLKREEKGLTDQDLADEVELVGRVKEYLTSLGLTDIAAQVEQMEQTLAERIEAREGKSDEELFSDYKLKLTYDPRFTELEGEVWQGKRRLDRHVLLDDKALIQLAKELKAQYKIDSEDYTELEKIEHRPRVLLRVHPETPYGQVQAMAANIGRHIPVSIVPWEKK